MWDKLSFPFLKGFCLVLFLNLYASFGQQRPTTQQLSQNLDKCYKLLINGDFEGAYSCLEKQKPFLEEAGYQKGLTVKYYTQLSDLYITQGQPEKALEIISEGYEKYKNDLPEEGKNRFRILELMVLERLDKNYEILSRIEKIMPVTNNKKHKATLYTIQASSLAMTGKYEEAALGYHQSLRIFKSLGDSLNIPTIYNRLGLLSQNTNDPEKALDYYEQALWYAQQINSVSNIQAIYGNMGSAYKEMDSLDKALEYYKKNAELAKEYGNTREIARNLLNTGNTYLAMNDYPKAFANFKESLAMSKQMGISIGILYNYICLGKAYAKTKQFEQSKTSYDSALTYTKQMGMPAQESDVYYGLYKMYERAGDFENSLFFYIKSDSIKNELLDEDKQKAIAEIEIRYQTELKDAEIKKMDSNLEKKRAQNKSLLIGLVSLGIIGGFLFFFLMYRNRTLRKLYERNVELMNSFKHKTNSTPNVDLQNTENSEDDNLKNVFNKLLSSLEKEKIFTDPDISLSRTAEIVKSNEKYVSSAISAYAKTNYNNFINSYRINEAKLLIYEDNKLNINEVMYASGFSSRTTFYDAFKKHTGMSPKQFKDLKTEAA